MLLCDDYLMPTSLTEALEMMASAPEGSQVISGGTDLLPWAREGRAGDVSLPALIDVSRVPELSGIASEGGRTRLGANTVVQQFLNDGKLRKTMPCMPYCAVWFADDQIREQASLAGNLVNASPAADTTPAILTLNGEVELARLVDGKVSTRQMPVSDFIKGPGTTDLQADEIVTAVICDALEGYGGAFEKVGQRRSLVISVACAACLVKPSANGAKFDDVRLALAGVGPVPMRLSEIEVQLTGAEITHANILAASKQIDGLVRSRTRQTYRKAVVEGFIERALLNALSDCGVEVELQENRELASA